MSRDYNGSSDYLTIASAIVSPPFSLAGWAQTDNAATNQTIFSLHSSSGGAHQARLLINSTGALRFNFRNATQNETLDTSTTLSASTWFHFAVTCQTTLREIWLDGGGKNSSTTSITAPTVNETNIGRNNSLPATHWFDGRISSLCVWTGTDILTDAQVVQLAAGIDPRAVKPQNIFDYWDAIEGRLGGVKGNAWSIGSGTTVAATHPKLFFVPQRYQSLFVPASTTVTSTFASTLANATMAATGTETISGTFASTLSDATMAASGTVTNPVTSDFASALDAVTMAATGTVANPITSDFASTLDAVTMAASGTVVASVTSDFSSTLDAATMAASGTVANPITSDFASILDAATMAASGSVVNLVTSDFASILDDAEMSASGSAGSEVRGRRRKTRAYRVNLYDPDAILPEAFEGDRQAVKELIQESIYIGGLAAKIAAPYRSDKRYQAAKLQSQAKTLRKLIKAYRAEIEEREREERILLLM